MLLCPSGIFPSLVHFKCSTELSAYINTICHPKYATNNKLQKQLNQALYRINHPQLDLSHAPRRLLNAITWAVPTQATMMRVFYLENNISIIAILNVTVLNQT